MEQTRRVALVTGGNRGIGFELCRQLGAGGHRVWMACRDRERGDAAVHKLRKEGMDVGLIQMDLSKGESVLQAMSSIHEKVEVLINNAAILDRQNIFNLEDPELIATIQTNLIGPMILAKHLAARMRERGWGRIVNITSGMGSFARGLGSDSPAYRVSKAGLNAFTVCLAESLRGSGVLVNSVDPGWVRTDMGGRYARRNVEDAARSVLWAVQLPDQGPSGVFFYNGKSVEW